MERVKIEIEILRNDRGVIFLVFDGSSYVPVRNILENNGLLSTLEVELDYRLKEKKDK